MEEWIRKSKACRALENIKYWHIDNEQYQFTRKVDEVKRNRRKRDRWLMQTVLAREKGQCVMGEREEGDKETGRRWKKKKKEERRAKDTGHKHWPATLSFTVSYLACAPIALPTYDTSTLRYKFHWNKVYYEKVHPPLPFPHWDFLICHRNYFQGSTHPRLPVIWSINWWNIEMVRDIIILWLKTLLQKHYLSVLFFHGIHTSLCWTRYFRCDCYQSRKEARGLEEFRGRHAFSIPYPIRPLR